MKIKTISILVGATVALFSVASAMAASQAQYKIKLDPPTGTLIPSTALESSIALNKRFFELSEDEKSRVRDSFGNLSVNQIPPFPTKGLKSIYRPLITVQEKSARGGVLSLVATIDAQGQVESVRVVQSPSKSLTQASKMILDNTQFDPAFCGGEPCAMEFPLEITFR